MTNNPIFDRALLHSRWPSPRTTLILFGVFVVAGVIYTGAVHQIDSANTVGISISLVIFGLLSLLVAILSAPLSALITCLHLPGLITSSDFQAIRLTGLSRRKIVDGYLLIALYRLRLLWVLTFGMLFVLAFLLAKGLGQLDALVATIPGGMMGISFNWLAICTGLWASVRWGQRWIALMVTLAITGLALLLSLGALFGMLMGDGQWWGIPVIVLMLSVAIGLSLLRQAEERI